MALYRLEVSSFAFPVKPLKRLILGKPKYGANERGVVRASKAVPRYVRITDIDEYGRLRDGLGVAAENVETQYLLNDGDLLFARSGNTVGKAYLHTSTVGESFLFAGYMIRLRADITQVMPEYVFLCTQLEFYTHWVAATQRATGQPNINAEEYRSLEIPVPGLAVQASLVQRYKAAIRSYESSIAKALDLLAGIDNYLLVKLGITLPPEPQSTIASRIFTAQRRELAGWRFDPQALHPEREACIAELQKRASHPLRKSVTFWRDLRTEIPDGAIYIGLENIEANTGRYLPSSDKESVSSAFSFRKGQVLFPKLRPYLNKVFLAPFDGLCSTEFHVLDGKLVRSEFLALFLRSQLVVKQTKHLMSGNTLPRLQTEDIENLLIPEVDEVLQVEICSEAKRRMAQADRLRDKAELELDKAKRQIEAMLLGEVTP
jgi:gamma-glutamylcyclotransferase (GGCT)/AIG2-like uncharacterized protein YtfP